MIKVIMGRKTWETIGRPLVHRVNIIISKTLKHVNGDNCFIFENISDAYNYCNNKYDIVWVIGGGQIYNEFLTKYNELLDECLITKIPAYYNCDTWFPPMDGWKSVSSEILIDNIIINSYKKR